MLGSRILPMAMRGGLQCRSFVSVPLRISRGMCFTTETSQMQLGNSSLSKLNDSQLSLADLIAMEMAVVTMVQPALLKTGTSAKIIIKKN